MLVSMTPQTPYSKDLGDREPLRALADTAERIRALTAAWKPADFERSYATGKWSARQVLIHLAQSELALGTRVRMALTVPGYTAQPFDQDRWMTHESALGAREALEAFSAMATMNRLLFTSLSPADRAIPLAHPEYGALTVDWIIHHIAGHQIHHVKQLEAIGAPT